VRSAFLPVTKRRGESDVRVVTDRAVVVALRGPVDTVRPETAGPRTAQHTRAPLWLELLEGRLVPTNWLWISNVGDFATTGNAWVDLATNKRGNGLPQPGDTIEFNNGKAAGN
jgi:hypothetical protein